MGKLKSFFLKFSKELIGLRSKDINYIQMRLPVSKITPEYEQNLKDKVSHNILKAEIREATMVDVDSLKILHDLAWHSTPMPYRPLDREMIIENIKDDNIIFLVAKVDGEDCGFALIYFTGESKKIGVIAGMGILPRLQKKGLGTMLGLATWNYFKARGVVELRCKVYIDNNASYKFIKGLQFEEYDDEFVQWKML
jgi:ribosomal protein S18 acetylase RimI-like enzyme